MTWQSHPHWLVRLVDEGGNCREESINAATHQDVDEICRIRFPNLGILDILSWESRFRKKKEDSVAVQTPQAERDRTQFDNLRSKAMNPSDPAAAAAALEIIDIETKHSAAFCHNLFLEIVQIDFDPRHESHNLKFELEQVNRSEGATLMYIDSSRLRQLTAKLPLDALRRLVQSLV